MSIYVLRSRSLKKSERSINKVMKPVIRHNLVRFKDALLFQPRNARGKKRTYNALLNRHTGDLKFEKIHTDPKEWKEVRLIIHEKPGKVTFDLRDPDGNHIRHQGLAAIAWKVACELLSALNCKADHLTDLSIDQLPEVRIVQDLAQEESATEHPIEEDPAWAGHSTRLAAEALLSTRPRGTYLLRAESGMTEDIAELLSSENDLFVQVYLLTYVADVEKIVDCCILETQRGWTVYRDNPDLNDSEYTFYPNVKTLLASLNAFAKTPLRIA